MLKPIPCSGVAEIVRYNWTQYLAAAGVIAGLVIVLQFTQRTAFSEWLTPLCVVGLMLTCWWTLASLLASWWIYDLSELRNWSWLHRLVPPKGKDWVYVHTGLDECGYQFRKQKERGQGVILDTYSAAVMTEPSIKRARADTADRRSDAACRWDAWPVKRQTAGICYFVLAAHELRKREERLALFLEARETLSQDGKLVVVEHARDFMNFLAFGPGFIHFWPPAEWDSLAELAGLKAIYKGRVAGFIITRVYGRAEVKVWR